MNRLVIFLALVICSITLLEQSVAAIGINTRRCVEVSDSLCVVYDYWEDLVGFYDNKPRFLDTYDARCLKVFDKWIHGMVKYDGMGRVIIQFVVKPDGTVADVKVLSGLDPELDNEIIRVVSHSPKWKVTGKHNGELVNVSIVFPVAFNP